MRARCRSAAKTSPSTILHVSKAPSPTVMPWSSAANAGWSAATSRPLTQIRTSLLMSLLFQTPAP